MHTSSRTQSGFTLIELVIVSVIVGVLAALVAMTYSGVQAKNRNTARQTNIKAIQSHLETYYAVYSQYPTGDNLADAQWRKENLKDMPTSAFRDPRWSTKVSCTAKEEAIPANGPTEKCYAYQVTSAEGSPCDNDKTPCAQYTLTATLEGGDKFVKSSLN